MAGNSLSDVPLEKRAKILERRLMRAQAALAEAETALEGRMRELDQANRDLTSREADLVEKLDMESAKLLAAQRVGGFATIYADRGKPYQSSVQLNRLLGVNDNIAIDPAFLISRIHPLDKARIRRSASSFFEIMAADTDHSFEHRILREDGELRWLRWQLRKEEDQHGLFKSVSGSVHDITQSRADQRQVRALQLKAERRVAELHRLSASLTKSQQQAEAAFGARTEFLSYMAHQFRTPLNTFSGMMDLLSIEERSAEDKQKLTFAARAAERLGSLVNEVIEEAEGHSSQTKLYPIATDLRQLCEETHEYWTNASSESEDGGTLKFSMNGSLPDSVLVDAPRLREALDNMIGYGLSAAGDVTLEICWTEGLMLSIQAGRLAADIDAKGFEALLKAEPQLRRANAIIAAMSGKLETQGQPAPSMYISLPLKVQHEAPECAGTLLRNQNGEPPSILVAEDTESNRYVIVGLCERLGCKVETAINGSEAVEAALSQQFDAILMDVQMPVMTGEEAVRHIRAADSLHSSTPVIGVTAHSLQAERDRLLASGMSACLAKPIELAELRTALATALTARRHSGDNANSAANLFDLRRFREAFEVLPLQFREKFLQAVREDLQNYGGKLQEAVTANDPEAADQQAHALKGIAGNVGAIGLLSALSEFRNEPLTLTGEKYEALTAKIAATLEACGDLFEALIKNQ